MKWILPTWSFNDATSNQWNCLKPHSILKHFKKRSAGGDGCTLFMHIIQPQRVRPPIELIKHMTGKDDLLCLKSNWSEKSYFRQEDGGKIAYIYIPLDWATTINTLSRWMLHFSLSLSPSSLGRFQSRVHLSFGIQKGRRAMSLVSGARLRKYLLLNARGVQGQPLCWGDMEGARILSLFITTNTVFGKDNKKGPTSHTKTKPNRLPRRCFFPFFCCESQ